MATRLRLSNLLRRSVVKAFADSTQRPATSLPSSHVMCRSMAFTKLFVGGLALTTHEQTLRNEFAKFGDVVDVRIITHPDSGKSKGFGFVTMADENQADTAIAGMDGKVVNARIISVNLAKAKKAPAFPSSFGQEGSVGQGSSVQGSFSEAGLGWNSSPKESFGDQSGFGGTIQSGFTQGIFKDDIQDSSRVGSGQQKQNSSEFPHRMPNISATSQSGSLPLNPSVKTPHDASWEDFLNGIEFGSGQGDSSQGSKRDTENSSLGGVVSSQSDRMKSSSVQENIGQGITSSSGLGEYLQSPKTTNTDSWDSFLSKIESDSSNSIEKTQRFEPEESHHIGSM